MKDFIKLMVIGTFLSVGIFMLFGCKTVSSKLVTSTKDSSTHFVNDISSADKHTSHEVKTKDTAIVVPFATVSSKLTIADLLPNYNAAGEPVAKIISSRNGNLSGTITIHPDTTIEFTSQFDSLTMVIKNLTTDVLRVKETLNSSIESRKTSNVERITWRELISKAKPFFSGSTIILVVAMVVIVFLFIKKNK